MYMRPEVPTHIHLKLISFYGKREILLPSRSNIKLPFLSCIARCKIYGLSCKLIFPFPAVIIWLNRIFKGKRNRFSRHMYE